MPTSPTQVPDLDVLTTIDAGTATLTAGTNLFRGKMRAVSTYIPSQAVFVLNTAGAPPQTLLKQASGQSARHFFPTVQIVVRSNPRDFSGGQTLARAIRDIIHNATISGYIYVKVRESEPIFLDEQENEVFIWSLNVDLVYEHVS